MTVATEDAAVTSGTAVTAGTPRHRRKGVLGVALLLISLPVVLAVTQAVSFYARNAINRTIVSAGIEREYLLYVPVSYDRTKPTPLVISMHGASMWPAAQREVDRWDRVADANGFIVVYPSGVSRRGPRAWRAGAEPGLTEEVRFISELIDTLRAGYNIDPTRIYANGLSNGGGMAFALSCRLSDKIAAVGVVATAIFLPWNRCSDERPVPMVVFQGTADRAIPYHGGESWVTPAPYVFPDIPAWTARWAVRNGCQATPFEWAVAPDVVRIEYPKCAEHSAVVLYRIEDGGHTWPGAKPTAEWFAGTTTQSIDASELMWVFFRAHPLRTAQAAAAK
jgi:polyhydroxybutyrate depolymerase